MLSLANASSAYFATLFFYFFASARIQLRFSIHLVFNPFTLHPARTHIYNEPYTRADWSFHSVLDRPLPYVTDSVL